MNQECTIGFWSQQSTFVREGQVWGSSRLLGGCRLGVGGWGDGPEEAEQWAEWPGTLFAR